MDPNMGATPDGRVWTRYEYRKRTIGDWRELTGYGSCTNTARKTGQALAQPRTSPRVKEIISVPRVFLEKAGLPSNGNAYRAGRFFLECYMGRLLASWEVCRHGMAGPTDHSYGNVSPGDAVNNMIDDLENGKSETSLSYLIQSKNRIERLIANRLNSTK